MPAKKYTRKNAKPASNPNATLQYIALGVIVVVVIAVIYAIANAGRETAALAVPTSVANDPFLSQGGAAPTSAPNSAAGSGSTSATGAKTYDAYPPVIIDASKQYFATFKMAEGGEFVIQLYADKAPKTVNSFVFLAREGFFNGVTFHRVLEGFMAQGGDPTGTGMGGPGYKFENEDNDLSFDKAGVVAMANAGRDTNGSQFFITFGPTPHLDGGYTIFGQVTEGLDVVTGLTRRNPEQFPDFAGDAIETVTISEQ
jgi:peptidylprolyl isomerase